MDPVLVPLTQWGHDQTVAAGRAFREYWEANKASEKLSVYYSPHFRIVQSKDGFIQGAGSKDVELIQEAELLKEREHGDFDGLHPRLQEEKMPQLYKKLHHGTAEEKYFTKMPNGESIADVQNRMENFIEDIKEKIANQEDVMIISHGGNCRLLEQLLTHSKASWFDFEDTPQYGQIIKIDDPNLDAPSVENVFFANQRPKNLKHYKAESYYPKLNAGQSF
jgi:broad specificity phosphatase PhoE